MKKLIYICLVFCLMSCGKFLDVKPDIHMDIPNTLEDCELLLNDYSNLNMVYPSAIITAGEDFYLPTENWLSVPSIDDRNAYIWADEPAVEAFGWQGPYRAIFLANQILVVLGDIEKTVANAQKYDHILGNALFFRAFAYQQLVELYTMPYRPETAASEYGLPLKSSPDLVPTDGRATLQETYQAILNDYTRASLLLGKQSAGKTRPNKIAAYAGLARIYLDMQEYTKAYLYADSAWQLQPTLMDYNDLDKYEELPIPKNNNEVIFSAITGSSEAIGRYWARINSDLLNRYDAQDLRKSIYFMENEEEPGTYGYKGNYDQSQSGAFVGLTTSEVLLIHAEAASRTNRQEIAINDLKLLWKNRFVNGIYDPFYETDPQRVLVKILDERKRELVYRGRRWSDLKRLNQDNAFKVDLQRTVNGNTYSLPAGSLKYAFLIPQLVIDMNPSIKQNDR